MSVNAGFRKLQYGFVIIFIACQPPVNPLVQLLLPIPLENPEFHARLASPPAGGMMYVSMHSIGVCLLLLLLPVLFRDVPPLPPYMGEGCEVTATMHAPIYACMQARIKRPLVGPKNEGRQITEMKK